MIPGLGFLVKTDAPCEPMLHYNIIVKLGEVGMGIVYLVEDTRFERSVAIKFLPHHISSEEEDRR